MKTYNDRKNYYDDKKGNEHKNLVDKELTKQSLQSLQSLQNLQELFLLYPKWAAEYKRVNNIRD